MPFIPHTKDDIQQMLATINVTNIQQLFDEIPKDLLTADLSSLPPGITEMELMREMRECANQDAGLQCFIGAGAYEHHIPAAVWDIVGRGEFMTAYTPYQAEASQGTLQLLYEYQTMMARLMDLNVSNASLYDGASALAEAILMAVRIQRKHQSHRVLIPRTLHPYYRQVIHAIVSQQNIELIEIAFNEKTGRTDQKALAAFDKQEITALVIPQPNFFGVIEEVDLLTDWAKTQNAIAVAVVNPLAMALLKPPGQWGKTGVDIACGEGQPLGVPLSSGGPYYGFLTCKKEHVRQLPGRIIGRTVDAEGKQGFVLTLQAREQHIRRAKATSNICTNQGLLVTASTIYMSLLGPEGLQQVALASHHQLRLLKEKIAQLADVKILFSSPCFHECVLQFKTPVKKILQTLATHRIQGGFNLQPGYPELGECLLVCVTETKTSEDLEQFVRRLREAVSAVREVCV